VIHTSHLVDSAEQTFEEDEDEEFYEEGDRVALILDTKNADTWTEVLEELEYKVQLAQTPDHAAHKIKYFLYDIVILHETSMGVALKENPVYELILKLPMSDRRKIFVILVGDKFKTADNMRAYSLSVNLVVNEKNFDKIEIILKKAFSDNNAFYKIFKDTLQTLGKI
jgi:hypothetical protein